MDPIPHHPHRGTAYHRDSRLSNTPCHKLSGRPSALDARLVSHERIGMIKGGT